MRSGLLRRAPPKRVDEIGPGVAPAPGHSHPRGMEHRAFCNLTARSRRRLVAPSGGKGMPFFVTRAPGAGVAPGPVVPVVRSAAMLTSLRRGTLAAGLGLLVATSPAFGQAQSNANPAPSRTRAHVEALASPKLEGRLTGTTGADAAAAYIERELKRIGARPLPGATSFRVPFSFTSGIKDDGSSVAVALDPEVTRLLHGLNDHARVLSFSDAGSVTGPVVFAGYGLRVPADNGGFVYDSYAGLDVKDKVVLVLRYTPENADREQREQQVRFSALR